MGRSATKRVVRKKQRARQRLQGHPANVDRLRRGMDPEDPATKQERKWSFEVRDLARTVKQEATANPAEGLLVGPLVGAARFLAPSLVKHWGLEGEEHEVAAENFLVERLMGALEQAASPEGAIDYRDWRIACPQRVRAA